MKVSKKNTKSSSRVDVVELVSVYLKRYIYLTEQQAEAIAVWVCAAWLKDHWVKFPHLCIVSPEKRCGKTTLLTLLSHVVPIPIFASSISSAAVYRLIKQRQPTIIMDESQSLSSARSSDSGEVMKILLNAAIEKRANVIKAVPTDMESIIEYNLYSPKIFALIGEADGVLADRCLVIEMSRKDEDLELELYRDIQTVAEGDEITKILELWTKEIKKKVQPIYLNILPDRIGNERLANLLIPLRTVLAVIGREEKLLTEYTKQVTNRELSKEYQSIGVMLLTACKEIFGKAEFLGTADLLQQLHARDEEPWHRYNRGKPLSSETLSVLLRKYKIAPTKKQTRIGKKVKGIRGYEKKQFEKPWKLYTAKIGAKL